MRQVDYLSYNIFRESILGGGCKNMWYMPGHGLRSWGRGITPDNFRKLACKILQSGALPNDKYVREECIDNHTNVVLCYVAVQYIYLKNCWGKTIQQQCRGCNTPGVYMFRGCPSTCGPPSRGVKNHWFERISTSSTIANKLWKVPNSISVNKKINNFVAHNKVSISLH